MKKHGRVITKASSVFTLKGYPLSPTSCFFAILGDKSWHLAVLTVVILIGYITNAGCSEKKYASLMY